MTMSTTVKTTVYAKKLRTRLATLRKQREAALRQYDKDVVKWRADFATWLHLYAAERIKAIGKKELKDNDGRYNREPGFSTSAFFRGAPSTPKYPNDQTIRDVQKALHYLAVTGQATVRVDEDDAKKFFGDCEDD